MSKLCRNRIWCPKFTEDLDRVAQQQAMQVVDRKYFAVRPTVLKIWWEQSRVGSIPTLGTNLNPQDDVSHPAGCLPPQADS